MIARDEGRGESARTDHHVEAGHRGPGSSLARGRGRHVGLNKDSTRRGGYIAFARVHSNRSRSTETRRKPSCNNAPRRDKKRSSRKDVVSNSAPAASRGLERRRGRQKMEKDDH